MTTKKITVPVYAQNCAMGGHAVPQRAFEDHPDSDDFRTFEGTPVELLAEADELDPAKGYRGHWCWKTAQTIREAVYWHRPDLKPVEDEDEDKDV